MRVGTAREKLPRGAAVEMMRPMMRTVATKPTQGCAFYEIAFCHSGFIKSFLVLIVLGDERLVNTYACIHGLS